MIRTVSGHFYQAIPSYHLDEAADSILAWIQMERQATLTPDEQEAIRKLMGLMQILTPMLSPQPHRKLTPWEEILEEEDDVDEDGHTV